MRVTPENDAALTRRSESRFVMRGDDPAPVVAQDSLLSGTINQGGKSHD
jgi:hypothetical protein